MRKRLFGIFGTVFLLIGGAFAQSETLFSNLLQPVDTADKPSFVFAGQSYATMFQTGGITTSIDGASFFISNEADGTHGLPGRRVTMWPGSHPSLSTPGLRRYIQ